MPSIQREGAALARMTSLPGRIIEDVKCVWKRMRERFRWRRRFSTEINSRLAELSFWNLNLQSTTVS